MAEIKQIIKDLDFQQQYVGNMFLNPPDNNFSRVNIFGEITQLSEFTEESLYLFYEFALPLGWKIDDENEHALLYKEEKVANTNLNKLKSVSQISSGYVNENAFSFFRSKDYKYHRGGDLKELDVLSHNFSYPFELELLGHNSILTTLTPKLTVQINSVDSWNRHRIEGYSFINIPIKTGFTTIDVPCFKPKDDPYMQIFSYFLGGSRKIPELKELFKTSIMGDLRTDDILNKYGIQTEFSGYLHLNLNVIIQNKNIQEMARKDIKSKQAIHDYNINSTINQAFGSKIGILNEVDNTKGNFMKTTKHGMINRFSGK